MLRDSILPHHIYHQNVNISLPQLFSPFFNLSSKCKSWLSLDIILLLCFLEYYIQVRSLYTYFLLIYLLKIYLRMGTKLFILEFQSVIECFPLCTSALFPTPKSPLPFQFTILPPMPTSCPPSLFPF